MLKYTKVFTQVDVNAISDTNTSHKHFKNQKHNSKKIHFFLYYIDFLLHLYIPYYIHTLDYLIYYIPCLYFPTI